MINYLFSKKLIWLAFLLLNRGTKMGSKKQIWVENPSSGCPESGSFIFGTDTFVDLYIHTQHDTVILIKKRHIY